MVFIPLNSAGIIYTVISAFMLLGGIYEKNPTFIILGLLGSLWGYRIAKRGTYETVGKDRLALAALVGMIFYLLGLFVGFLEFH